MAKAAPADDTVGSRALILVRHGRSEGNARDLFNGWLDLPLTELSETEAIDAARAIAESGIRIDVIFTLALQQEMTTADTMVRALGPTGVKTDASAALNERR